MTKWRPVLLWWVVWLHVIFNGDASVQTMRLQLVHRHAVQSNSDEVLVEMPKRTQLDRLKELLHSDSIRERMRRKAWERGRRGGGRNASSSSSSLSSGEMPISSAADFGSGQYLVTVTVGTPAQRLTLIADTGSDLTWMNCEYRRCGSGGCAAKRRSRSPRLRRRRRVYRAYASSSFKTVPCLSEFCKVELTNLFSLARCPTPLTPCAFDYRFLSQFLSDSEPT